MLSAYCHSILWLERQSVGVILQPNLNRNTLRNHPCVYVKGGQCLSVHVWISFLRYLTYFHKTIKENVFLAAIIKTRELRRRVDVLSSI